MGFILDGLESEQYDRVYGDLVLVRRILSYFRPHAGRIALIVGTLVLSSAAGSAGPIVISRAINIVTERPTVPVFALLGVAVVLLGVFGWTMNYLLQRTSAWVTGHVVLKLREDAFAATIGHDMSFFDEFPSGKVVSRITSDTQDFSTTVTLVTDLATQFLLVAILAGFLFTIEWRLTAFLLAMAPIAVAIALSFRRIARRVTQRARRIVAVINAQIHESISGIIVAKGYRRERSIYDTFDTNNKKAYRVGLQRGLVLNAIFPVMSITSGLGIGALVYAGGLTIRGGSMTPGDFYLFMQAVGFFWWPLLNVASFWSQFQDGLSAAERVFALIDAEPRVVQTAAEKVTSVAGRITFDAVDFAYKSDEPVLRDFSLEIAGGERIAIVGHTGAGKSSLARLITRFYDFQGGRISIDGRDIRTLDLTEYRKHVGLVPQDPFLFSGTVRDNIRYGLPGATDDDVRAAAAHISDGEWLEDLPMGLETHTGTRGSSLSMGQRQLVALARILLKNPAVFILDEATASVDPFTEAQIQDGLNAAMADRTSIVIAHRLWTVRHADRIIVLESGRIIEQGRHDKLMAGGGKYAELYDTYFRHQSLEYIEKMAGV
ncbi:MAG: ABC transporter ATP-binding protein [Spirochaetaceae bacterium]|nr:MAG: ABC transporter ATP-binding protein [Spirochaetaceae bacterium]